jgi:hypothetical protein
MAKKGKKKCSKCGRFFDPRGIKRHMETCKPKKKAKKKAAPKERFVVLAFTDDLEYFSEASSLKQAEEQASEVVGEDYGDNEETLSRRISVFKVVAEYDIRTVRKAVLTPKKK